MSPAPGLAPADAMRQQGVALIQIGRPAEALPVLHRALAAAPDDAIVLTTIAWAYLDLGDLENASRSVAGALAAGPNLEWPHRIRSMILSRQKNLAEALEEAKRAVAIMPRAAYPLNQLFTVQRALKQLPDAWNTAHEMLRVAPEDSLSHMCVGLINLDYRRNADAEAAFRRALAISPDSQLALNNLGVTLQRMGRDKEALELFHHAAQIDPRWKLARDNFGTARKRFFSLGSIGIVVAIGLAMALSGIGDAFHISEDQRAVIFWCSAAVGVLVTWLVRRSRYKQLDPSVQRFADEDQRQSRRRLIYVALTPVTLFMAFLWLSSIAYLLTTFELSSVLTFLGMSALLWLTFWGWRRNRGV